MSRRININCFCRPTWYRGRASPTVSMSPSQGAHPSSKRRHNGLGWRPKRFGHIVRLNRTVCKVALGQGNMDCIVKIEEKCVVLNIAVTVCWIFHFGVWRGGLYGADRFLLLLRRRVGRGPDWDYRRGPPTNTAASLPGHLAVRSSIASVPVSGLGKIKQRARRQRWGSVFPAVEPFGRRKCIERVDGACGGISRTYGAKSADGVFFEGRTRVEVGVVAEGALEGALGAERQYRGHSDERSGPGTNA